jgi:spore coat polysaccharide biosynthesis protein SpsF
LDSTDDPLVKILEKENIPFFRGALEDVLSRFAAIGEEIQPTHIVRITGDCPLIDWSIIDLAVKTAFTSEYFKPTNKESCFRAKPNLSNQ